MRHILALVLVAALVVVAMPASAEFQNLQIGGELRIRANWYSDLTPEPTGRYTAVPNIFMPFRGTGEPVLPFLAGPANAVTSRFGFDDSGTHNTDFVEQRVRLSLKADFTDNVTMFIELDSYDIWSEDNRTYYVTGQDFRANSADDVEVYQAYIEAREMWGLPLSMRIGRQELVMGSEWLLGNNDTSSLFRGLAYDAICLAYEIEDVLVVRAVAAMQYEGNLLNPSVLGPPEEDDDVWLYGIYATYLGLEDIAIDAYWLWARDARSIQDTNFVAPLEWLEDLFDLDDYDVQNMHTVGLRGAGSIGAFDFEAEAAYQFGEADQVGALFAPFLYGDDGADFDAWGANLELGYQIECRGQPRIYIGGAYFEGEDDRDISFLEWINPFTRPDASVSFNRLCSDWEYSEFIDDTHLSNAYIIRGGVQVQASEKVTVELKVAHFVSLEDFDSPAYIELGQWQVPIAPALSFWDMESDDDLGTEVGLYVTYDYTEDLVFEVGWAHLFTGEGLDDGNYNDLNGLGFIGGTDDDDVDYVYFETRISF